MPLLTLLSGDCKENVMKKNSGKFSLPCLLRPACIWADASACLCGNMIMFTVITERMTTSRLCSPITSNVRPVGAATAACSPPYWWCRRSTLNAVTVRVITLAGAVLDAVTDYCLRQPHATISGTTPILSNDPITSIIRSTDSKQ